MPRTRKQQVSKQQQATTQKKRGRSKMPRFTDSNAFLEHYGFENDKAVKDLRSSLNTLLNKIFENKHDDIISALQDSTLVDAVAAKETNISTQRTRLDRVMKFIDATIQVDNVRYDPEHIERIKVQIDHLKTEKSRDDFKGKGTNNIQNYKTNYDTQLEIYNYMKEHKAEEPKRYITIALYTLILPRRGKSYYEMYLSKNKKTEPSDKTKNYLWIDENDRVRLITNVDKTIQRYPESRITDLDDPDLIQKSKELNERFGLKLDPQQLKTDLLDFVRTQDIKTGGCVLLNKFGQCYTPDSFSAYVTKISERVSNALDKDYRVGINDYRHFAETKVANADPMTIKYVSSQMLHSPRTAAAIYVVNEDGERIEIPFPDVSGIESLIAAQSEQIAALTAAIMSLTSRLESR
jgi:hypothetical protein